MGVCDGEEDGVGVPVGVADGVVDTLQPPPAQGAAAGVGDADAVHQGHGAPVGDGAAPTRHAAARLFAPVKAGLGRHDAGESMRERGVPSGPHVLEAVHVVKFAPVAPHALTPRARTGESL